MAGIQMGSWSLEFSAPIAFTPTNIFFRSTYVSEEQACDKDSLPDTIDCSTK